MEASGKDGGINECSSIRLVTGHVREMNSRSLIDCIGFYVRHIGNILLYFTNTFISFFSLRDILGKNVTMCLIVSSVNILHIYLEKQNYVN